LHTYTIHLQATTVDCIYTIVELLVVQSVSGIFYSQHTVIARVNLLLVIGIVILPILTESATEVEVLKVDEQDGTSKCKV